MMHSTQPPARPAGDVEVPITALRWKVGSIPAGSGPREIDTALQEAARPFMDDGYRSTARAGDGVQLARPRRTWLPGRILAAIGWLGSALLGWLFPIYLMPGWTVTDPIYLWVDAAGDIWAVREQVLRTLEYRT